MTAANVGTARTRPSSEVKIGFDKNVYTEGANWTLTGVALARTQTAITLITTITAMGAIRTKIQV